MTSALPPIFIPLRREYFEQFAWGLKDTEYRRYGRRWNEHVCIVGRSVLLSMGYSGPRLAATIEAFEVLDREPETSIYPPGTLIAAIRLTRISMDPTQTLMDLDVAIVDRKLSQAVQLLAAYYQWRVRGGFEPRWSPTLGGGDAFAELCAARLADAVESAD